MRYWQYAVNEHYIPMICVGWIKYDNIFLILVEQINFLVV